MTLNLDIIYIKVFTSKIYQSQNSPFNLKEVDSELYITGSFYNTQTYEYEAMIIKFEESNCQEFWIDLNSSSFVIKDITEFINISNVTQYFTLKEEAS